MYWGRGPRILTYPQILHCTINNALTLSLWSRCVSPCPHSKLSVTLLITVSRASRIDLYQVLQGMGKIRKSLPHWRPGRRWGLLPSATSLTGGHCLVQVLSALTSYCATGKVPGIHKEGVRQNRKPVDNTGFKKQKMQSISRQLWHRPLGPSGHVDKVHMLIPVGFKWPTKYLHNTHNT